MTAALTLTRAPNDTDQARPLWAVERDDVLLGYVQHRDDPQRGWQWFMRLHNQSQWRLTYQSTRAITVQSLADWYDRTQAGP